MDLFMEDGDVASLVEVTNLINPALEVRTNNTLTPLGEKEIRMKIKFSPKDFLRKRRLAADL